MNWGAMGLMALILLVPILLAELAVWFVVTKGVPERVAIAAMIAVLFVAAILAVGALA